VTDHHELNLELLAGYALLALEGEDALEADRLLSDHVPWCATCRATLADFQSVTGELALERDGRFLAIRTTWLADSGAYSLGRRFGKHKMSPRLSPRKTWEGYVGSVLTGAVGGGLLSAFWHVGAGPDSLLTWQTGASLGALVGALGPVGDLGISMMKRQVGLKDTGALLAGHGGALDRMDSWLVAVTVGYYFVLVLQAVS